MLALLRKAHSPRLLRSVEPLARLRRELNSRLAEAEPPTKGPLSTGERAALKAGGFRSEARSSPPGRSGYEELLATGLSVEEVADRLGVNTSRVRQRLLEGSLYGVKHEGRWTLPRFQLAGNGIVPGLAEVLPIVKDLALHPVAVQRWFGTKQPELVLGEGEPMTPLEWLREGHPPSAVIELLESL
jgi:hypothetical protein